MEEWGTDPASVEALSTLAGSLVTGSVALLALRQYRKQIEDRKRAAPQSVTVTGSYGRKSKLRVTMQISNWGSEPIRSVGLVVLSQYVEPPIDPTDSRLLYMKVTNSPRSLFLKSAGCQHLYQFKDLHPLYPGQKVRLVFDGEPTFSAYKDFGVTFIDVRGVLWTCRSGSGYWRGWRAGRHLEEPLQGGKLSGYGVDPWPIESQSPMYQSTVSADIGSFLGMYNREQQPSASLRLVSFKRE